MTHLQAVWRPEPQRHNIWEQVLHAAYWKHTVRRRILGEKRGSFQIKGSNWITTQETAAAWRRDVKLLVETHESMRSAIAELSTVRWNADDLEKAIVTDLDSMRLPTQEVATWLRKSIQAAFADINTLQRNQQALLIKRRSELVTMNDRLLNTFLAGVIDEDKFNAKRVEFRDEGTRIDEQLSKAGDLEPTDVDAALAVFDFTQNAAEIWDGSKMLEKRQILESLSLNRTLGYLTLVLEKRKPFDLLSERPSIQLSRDDCPIFEPFSQLGQAFTKAYVEESGSELQLLSRIAQKSS